MPDFGRIKGNVKKMIEQNAPDQDINDYLKYEGVTAQDLRADKTPPTPEKGWVQKAYEGAPRDTGDENLENIQRAAAGNLKSKYGSAWGMVPFSKELGLNPDTIDLSKGMMSTVDDPAYGDVWEKQLKDAGVFKSRTKDSKGREILTFIGDDGKEHRAYVNTPGLEAGDFARTATQMLPSIVAGGVVGAGVRGAGIAGRALMQGLGQGATEVGRDVVAATQGSKQGVDPVRAPVAALGGAAGEGIVAAMSALRGSAIGRAVVRKLHAGDDLTPREMAHFRDTFGPDATPDDFRGLTAGQITGNRNQLALESQARHGTLGRGMQERTAVIDEAVPPSVAENLGINVDDTVGANARVGADLQREFTMARRGAAATEDAAWRTAERARLEPQRIPLSERTGDPMDAVTGRLRLREALPQESIESLQRSIADNIDATDILPGTRGEAALNALNRYAETGGLPENASNISGSLGAMRKHLYGLMKSAPPNERVAAGNVYGAFNDWVDDMADRGLIQMQNGVEGADLAAAYNQARAVSRNLRELFNPGSGASRQSAGSLSDRAGGRHAARRLLQKVFDDEGFTPASVSKELFKSPGTPLKSGEVTALDSILNVSIERAGGRMQPMLREAYILNTIVDPKTGRLLPTDRILANVRAQRNNQAPVLSRLGLTDAFRAVERRAEAAMRGTARATGKQGALVQSFSDTAKGMPVIGELFKFFPALRAGRSLRGVGTIGPARSQGNTAVRTLTAPAGAQSANALMEKDQ